MTAVDDIAVLTAMLTEAGTALYTANAARVYYGMLPAGFDNTTSAVVFRRTGGQPDVYHPVVDVDYQVKCYGGSSSFAQAEAIYRALRETLHAAPQREVTDGAVVTADETQMGQPIIDPDAGWPYVLTFYHVAIRPL